MSFQAAYGLARAIRQAEAVASLRPSPKRHPAHGRAPRRVYGGVIERAPDWARQRPEAGEDLCQSERSAWEREGGWAYLAARIRAGHSASFASYSINGNHLP
jgi:hypothetical protein